ncbi:MAG TPA: hypothetical protein QGF05_02600 [Dehalococcoidia bacterium]|jgi:hypothetical protein|nr:hypothetical protein [Dehalococcoidia bacterium]
MAGEDRKIETLRSIRCPDGWGQQSDRSSSATEPNLEGPLIGVRPLVTDTRNVLLIQPLTDDPPDDTFIKSLAYAFQRGVEYRY